MTTFRQDAVERRLRWAIAYLEEALEHQEGAEARLSYWTRRDLAELLPKVQALLDEAEANYRKEYGKEAA